MLFKWIFKQYFKLTGWKLVGENPKLKKYVFIVAPHTSQFDFILGKMYTVVAGLKTSFLIKKEAFAFPVGPVLRALGGVPVDRATNKRLAEQLVTQFETREQFILIITPEGTRKKVKRWKRGFHYIASEAKVPVVLAFIDYKTRSLGIGPQFDISDDYQKDMLRIKEFYKGMQGRHPDRFTTGD